jgi:hypothetical protein
MEGGNVLEEALDLLVTEAQLLWLRGELFMDKGLLKQALDSLQSSEAISEKLCDDVAISRCLRYLHFICVTVFFLAAFPLLEFPDSLRESLVKFRKHPCLPTALSTWRM